MNGKAATREPQRDETAFDYTRGYDEQNSSRKRKARAETRASLWFRVRGWRQG
jgi:hypothetical protein